MKIYNYFWNISYNNILEKNSENNFEIIFEYIKNKYDLFEVIEIN